MTNLQGNFLLELWNYNVTTALPINSDEVSLVYIGASNMSGNFLFKVFIHTDFAQGVTIHWTGPLDWTTGLDYWTHL